MSDIIQDRVHQIRDELVQLGIIPSEVKLKTNNRLDLAKTCFFSRTISYNTKLNEKSSEGIVWLLGHEYGHIKLPQYSSLVITIAILLFTHIMRALSEFYKDVNIHWLLFLLIVLITAVLFSVITMWATSKWLKEDEYRSDIEGARGVIEYGTKKGIKLDPYKSFTDLVKDTKVNLLKSKFDFVHPSSDERKEKIEEFKNFYYSQAKI